MSRRGRPDSHVFGTIHVADPRVLLLPDAVQAMFANDGESVVIEAKSALDMLLLAGEPINEPVVSWE